MNQYISELAAFSFPFIELMVIFSSVKQSSSQSSGPSVSRLVIRCINQKRIVRSWSVSQSVSEPVCQTASQPVWQSASLPYCHSASLPVSCTASQPVCQSVVLPFSQTASQPVYQCTSLSVQISFYRWIDQLIIPVYQLEGTFP